MRTCQKEWITWNGIFFSTGTNNKVGDAKMIFPPSPVSDGLYSTKIWNLPQHPETLDWCVYYQYQDGRYCGFPSLQPVSKRKSYITMKHFLFKQIVKSRGILLLPEWSHMINASTLGRKGTVPLLILIIPTLYTNMLSLIMQENFKKIWHSQNRFSCIEHNTW